MSKLDYDYYDNATTITPEDVVKYCEKMRFYDKIYNKNYIGKNKSIFVYQNSKMPHINPHNMINENEYDAIDKIFMKMLEGNVTKEEENSVTYSTMTLCSKYYIGETFNPTLIDIVNLFSQEISFQELKTINRIYSRAQLDPFDNLKDCYNPETNECTAVTHFYIFYN